MPHRGRHHRRQANGTTPVRQTPYTNEQHQTPPPPYHKRGRANRPREHQLTRQPNQLRSSSTSMSDAAGIRRYQDRLHPAVISAYSDIKASTTRLQMELENLVGNIDRIAPTENHIDWTFTPGTVVYVPVTNTSSDGTARCTPESAVPTEVHRPTGFDVAVKKISVQSPPRVTAPPDTRPEIIGTSSAYYPTAASRASFQTPVNKVDTLRNTPRSHEPGPRLDPSLIVQKPNVSDQYQNIPLNQEHDAVTAAQKGQRQTCRRTTSDHMQDIEFDDRHPNTIDPFNQCPGSLSNTDFIDANYRLPLQPETVAADRHQYPSCLSMPRTDGHYRNLLRTNGDDLGQGFHQSQYGQMMNGGMRGRRILRDTAWGSDDDEVDDMEM